MIHEQQTPNGETNFERLINAFLEQQDRLLKEVQSSHVQFRSLSELLTEYNQRLSKLENNEQQASVICEQLADACGVLSEQQEQISKEVADLIQFKNSARSALNRR